MMRLLFEFYLSTDIDNIKEQIRSDCPKTTFTGEQRVTVSVYDYTQRCEQTDFIDIRRKLFVGFLIVIGCVRVLRRKIDQCRIDQLKSAVLCGVIYCRFQTI